MKLLSHLTRSCVCHAGITDCRKLVKYDRMATYDFTYIHFVKMRQVCKLKSTSFPRIYASLPCSLCKKGTMKLVHTEDPQFWSGL